MEHQLLVVADVGLFLGRLGLLIADQFREVCWLHRCHEAQAAMAATIQRLSFGGKGEATGPARHRAGERWGQWHFLLPCGAAQLCAKVLVNIQDPCK